ncbi:MAG: RloB family protein [Marinisporobacter sp.]|jgi:hypothetical protein|nr:RloB family protein [Marinisporobacter sp.]
MKSVSLRTPKTFGQRTNADVELEPNKKYFLVVEGSNTERDYFNGVFNYRADLGIDDLIDIVVVEREDDNKTDSHPKHLLNGILIKIGKIEMPEGYPDDYSLIEYDEEIDEIWLIFDRDPGNFYQKQFDEIYEKCNEHNFKIGLTNPNFEFWLLLHLPDIDMYEKESLLQNKKVTKKRRFIEKELSDRLEDGYNKNRIRFERFKEQINLAIEQEKSFEQRIPDIFGRLGSNIGILISKMKND